MYLSDDQAVIEDFCKRAVVSAMADLIRHHDGQLVPYSTPRAAIEAPAVPQPDMHPVRHVEVTPVLAPPIALTWWERADRLSLALKTVGALAMLGLAAGVVWTVVVIIKAVVATVTYVVLAVTPILGILAIIFVLSLLGGFRNRRSFTFSGSGRLH